MSKKLLIGLFIILTAVSTQAQQAINMSLVTPPSWETALSIPLNDIITRYREMETANEFVITQIDDQVIQLFDKTAGDYIIKELKTDLNLRNARGINTSFYFFWSDGGNMQVHIERTLTDNRTWRDGGKIWKTDYGFNDGRSRGQVGYGADAVRYISPGQRYDTEVRIAFLQAMQDPEFTSVARDVHNVACVIDYDLAKAYGLRARHRNNGHKRGVCEDYADTLFLLLQENSNVKEIRKITGQNHAWIECDTVVSGKTIYCDATWYDSNYVDSQGFVVDIPRESLENITYDLNTFQYKGTSPNTGADVIEHIGTVVQTWTRE